jgi:hypothetical protein
MWFIINEIEGIISTALQVPGVAESAAYGYAAPLLVQSAKRLPAASRNLSPRRPGAREK